MRPAGREIKGEKDKMRRSIIPLLVISLLIPAISAGAYVFDGKDINVQYWVGNGSNEAISIVDFGSASYAFGCRWESEAPNSFDTMNAIADNGDLDLEIIVSSFGSYIDGISYRSLRAAGCKIDATTWAYWGYWNSEDGDQWTMSWDAPVDHTLSDGAWDGWSFAADGNATQPDLPGVPEPSSLMALVSLAGLAGSAKLLRRGR